MKFHYLNTFIVCIFFLNCADSKNSGTPEGKSLFDDLPLNGAYSPGVSLPSTPSKPSLVLRPIKNSENSIGSESVESRSSSKSDETPNSLFNILPNQGAMMSKNQELIFESKTKKRGIFATSQDLDRSPNGELRFQIQLERQTPTAEFNLADFHSNQLPAIVHAINREEPLKPYTVLSPPVIPVVTGVRVPLNTGSISNNHYGNYVPKPSNLYPLPPPPPTTQSSRNVRPNNLYAVPTQGTSKVLTHSVGPNANVIIYATPSPSPTPPTREVHHIYHPQRQRARPPPQARVRQRQRHFGGYGNGRPQNSLPIPIITGQGHAPSPPTVTGGYPTSASTSATGGYPANPATTSRPPTVNPATVSITQAPGTTPINDFLGDYDYDNLETVGESQRNHWNNFGARTGPFRFSSTFTNTNTNREPSTSYRIPPEGERTHEQHQHPYPSDNYGPPSNPSPSYGPPPPVAASYGVPEQPAQSDASPPAPPAPPVGSSTTSISYQTVPIQTVQTQLVTVPHITVSSTSPVESDSDSGFSRPQSPSRPSTAYGPPSSGQSSPSRSGALFTDDQIALLLSASRGAGGGGNLFDDDPLTLLSGINSNRGILNLNGDAGLQFPGSRLVGNGNSFIANQQFSGLGGTRLGNNLFSNNNQFPILGGGTRLGNNLFSNQLPLRNSNGITQNQLAVLLAQQRLNNGLGSGDALSLLGGTRNGPVLTRDAVDALSDILREQQLRGAVSDLSGRLRQEGRSAARARQNYRSLFYKGALLLSALTLIPAVATPLAAAASGLHTSSFLLPLASGRRKRDAGPEIPTEKLLDISPFEYCNQTFGKKLGKERKLGLSEWIECTSNATEKFYEQALSKYVETNGTGSMFDSMAFNGAYVPQHIRAELEKYVSPEEIVKNSECLQKRFCETLLEVLALPNPEAFLLLYSAFASDVENNPWIREAMNAVRNKSCVAFYCFEDYKPASTNSQ